MKTRKQRYLDYAYKIAVKRAFENYINDGILNPRDVSELFFHVDEHTTATNGRYELREALEQEFKSGTYNRNYNRFFPPIFPHAKSVNLEMCDSSRKTLVRAADVIANKVFYLLKSDNRVKIRTIPNLHTIYLP